MRSITIDELNWLHDADVSAIEYRIVEGVRSLRIVVCGHPDCGNAEWAGMPAVIEAHDVRDLTFRAAGWINGPESLDAVRGGHGAANNGVDVTFVFHSGAEIGLSYGALFARSESN